MSETIIIKKDNIEYLQFNKLLEFQDTLIHAYTLKTFNTGLGKDIEDRKENLKRLSSALKIKENCFVTVNQAHTNIVTELKKQALEEMTNKQTKHIKQGKLIILNKQNLALSTTANEPKADGLITNEKQKALVIGTADCICLMLFDPKNKVISNIHSGWKGTAKRIAQEAIYKMIKDYDCKPQNIICCICPALRKDHFLVNEDVVNIYKNEFPKYYNKVIEETEYTNEKGKQYKIDTVLINKLMLKDIGLLDKNIIDSKICTMCESDKFYSYRTEKRNLKNNIGVILLK